MSDKGQSREDLLREIDLLKQKVSETENSASELKKVRDALAEYERVVERLDELIAVVDSNHVYTLVNNAFLKQRSLTRDRVVGHSVSEVIGEEVYRKTIKPLLEKAFAGEAVFHEGEFDYPSLGTRVLQVEYYPVTETDGVGKVVCVIHDITEHTRMEEEIRKIQKLEFVGTLAGGIAHDFNNILGTILGYTNLAQLHVVDPDRLLDDLNHIQKSVTRATRLTRQLLTFSKGGAPVKAVLRLQPVIRDSVEFALSGSNVRADYAMAESLYTVEADKGLISQVVQNLVVNAVQAMPEGGVVTVSAENVCMEEKNSRALTPGRYVRLSFADKGAGISQEDLRKIFDPFFTTKEKSHGLGLATVLSIVRNHGGTVVADSEPGRGSTFDVYLPAPETMPDGSRRKQRPPAEKKGKVLVMDDDEGTRGYVRALLVDLGYEVVLAENGVEAIDAYGSAMAGPVPVDVVVLDLTVRGDMGGEAAMRELLKIDPGVKAIVASGYFNDPVMARYQEYGFRGVLSKPYELKELADLVNDLMEK